MIEGLPFTCFSLSVLSRLSAFFFFFFVVTRSTIKNKKYSSKSITFCVVECHATHRKHKICLRPRLFLENWFLKNYFLNFLVFVCY